MKEQLQLPASDAMTLREYVRQRLEGYKWRQLIRQLKRDAQKRRRRALAQGVSVQETFEFTEEAEV